MGHMDYQELDFPLNVYGAVLASAFGEAEYLGYACVDGTTGDFSAAQRAMAGHIVRALPAAPARVLELGCGTGALSARLAEQGYEVSAQTTNEAEAGQLRRRASSGVKLLRMDLATLAGTGERFDCIVMQNSLHYHAPLRLLESLKQLLRPGGRVLICDEFVTASRGRQPDPQADIAPLNSFLTLTQRLGYETRLLQDMSREVSAGFPLFLRLFDEHRANLAGHGGVTGHSLDRLREALQRDAERYRQGSRCHVLLALRRPVSDHDADQVRFGAIDSFEPEEVSELFERCFGQPFDAQLWHWKYGEGRGRAVCLRQGGRLVAHYGGASRSISYFGRPYRALQVCDVMVLPEKRGFYSRKGLFFKAAASFLELHIGNSAEHLLGFGFPNRKAMQVARRLGLYRKTDDFVEIRYDAPTTGEAHDSHVLECGDDTDGEVIPAEAAALWSAMAGDFNDSIIGVRDPHYLRYRYLDHPGGHYRLLSISTAGGLPCALAAIREHEGSILLMDVVAGKREMHFAIDALRHHVAKTEGMDLKCWLTRRQLPHLRGAHGRVHDLGIQIPCNAWTDGPGVAVLEGAWWLTAGDMDFM